LTAEDRQRLGREIAAIDENLDLLVELYEDRFFGVFPLVRLAIPFLLADEGFALTEQLFHSPKEAAVRSATKALLNQIGNVFDRLPDGLMLIFDRLLIFAFDQRVSADSN